MAKQEVAEELILSLAFFEVVGDGKETDPVGHELGGHGLVLHDVGVLVANDLAQTGDGIVLGVLILCHLVLLGLDLFSDGHVDGFLEGFEAELTIGTEGFSAVLGDDTDTIDGGLSEAGARVVTVLANGGDNGEPVLWGEVGWSEVLHHIVQNEERESESLDFTAGEGLWDHLGLAFVDHVGYEVLVSLEESSNDLSCGGLQIVLVGVLSLKESNILGVELVILIFSLLSGVVLVVLDPLVCAFNVLNHLKSKMIDFLC